MVQLVVRCDGVIKKKIVSGIGRRNKKINWRFIDDPAFSAEGNTNLGAELKAFLNTGKTVIKTLSECL